MWQHYDPIRVDYLNTVQVCEGIYFKVIWLLLLLHGILSVISSRQDSESLHLSLQKSIHNQYGQHCNSSSVSNDVSWLKPFPLSHLLHLDHGKHDTGVVKEMSQDTYVNGVNAVTPVMWWCHIGSPCDSSLLFMLISLLPPHFFLFSAVSDHPDRVIFLPPAVKGCPCPRAFVSIYVFDCLSLH